MRRGRLQQVAPPRTLYERPANAFVAGFVGESTLLDGVVVAVEGDEAVVETTGRARLRATRGDARPGDRVRVLLRPDAATVGDPSGAAGDRLAGAVEEVADPGPLVRAWIRLDGGERVIVTRPRRAAGLPLRPGARVALRWPAEDVRLLSPDS
jgi:ABC-type Fe3+/spermidine/putrescine transport system ATPase subunit